MKDGLLIGFCLGFVAGSVMVLNCKMVRNFVNKTQEELATKVKKTAKQIKNSLEKGE